MGIDSAPALCPECGRAFDPDDPETTTTLPRGEFLSGLVRRYSPMVAVILLVVSAVIHTVIPRPADLSDWRLWLWLDQKYGVEVRWTGGRMEQSHWWGGRRTSVHTRDQAGAPVWDVTWHWPDRWTVRAHQAGVRWQDLSGAYTDMKREMFGVTIGESARRTTDGPLEFSGTKVDVFSEMVNHFGIEVSPFLLRKNQPYVWLFDRELGRMIAVDRTKAAAMGYDVRLWRGGERTEPLIEVPAGYSPTFRQAPRAPVE